MPEAYRGDSPNAHFLVGDTPAPTQLKSRWGNALSVSFATHVAFFLILVFVVMMPGVNGPRPVLVDPNKYDLVWIPQEGPGGGGGGGGNKQIEPPRKAELPDKQQMTVPVTKPPQVEPLQKPKDPEPKVQELNIPAQVIASGVQKMPGVLSTMPSQPDTTSLGTGSGTGAGTGAGTGIGPGSGSGLGAGEGGGTGGGIYRLGSGISNPEPTFSPRPNYTADAMRAKVQGTVALEAVVLPNGSVGEVRITRSLDPHFGLDQEAIRTVKSWRFRPARKNGEPVPVWVDVELSFTLR
ncbi:MAG TPA: TonB family protein [Vicinamibacterales bacterium]|jgi:TonB family protein